ncbi:MAG TPA: nucleoside transporter C-terminal domain-containing protein [Balneolales bacterium]|nr:nucleoside transporter C-terminal domain-containing protein [Balneolales bacterium]
MNIVRGLIGIFSLLGIAFLFSNNKKEINWRLVIIGVGIQFILAIFILKGNTLGTYFSPLAWPKDFFSWVSSFFVAVLNFTTQGASFIFGDLAKSPGTKGSMGSFFAFQVLPTIVFFGSLTSLLYHYGILQRIVKYMAIVMQKLLGTSGAESLSVISNIFVGQTEAPLIVKPYIERMTQSELLAVMTGGMATIAGGVMAAYIQMLGNSYSQAHHVAITAGRLMFAQQLLGASIMAAPAALVISKMMYPETKTPMTSGKVKLSIEKTDANGIDAAASGAEQGLKLALNVGAMLLAFIALLAMINSILGWVGSVSGLNLILPGFHLNIQNILGLIFAPIAFLIGVPWHDVVHMGSLLGTKMVLTEFIAYMNLSKAVLAGTLAPKTITMATFALCGFANFTSIAIQIGGIGGLAPSRKSDLAKFGIKAVIAGTLANLMTATIAGMFFT